MEQIDSQVTKSTPGHCAVVSGAEPSGAEVTRGGREPIETKEPKTKTKVTSPPFQKELCKITKCIPSLIQISGTLLAG